jgi:hypothetical protein
MSQTERTIMASYKLLQEGRIEEVLLKKTRKGVDMYITTRKVLEELEPKNRKTV